MCLCGCMCAFYICMLVCVGTSSLSSDPAAGLNLDFMWKTNRKSHSNGFTLKRWYKTSECSDQHHQRSPEQTNHLKHHAKENVGRKVSYGRKQSPLSCAWNSFTLMGKGSVSCLGRWPPWKISHDCRFTSQVYQSMHLSIYPDSLSVLSLPRLPHLPEQQSKKNKKV